MLALGIRSFLFHIQPQTKGKTMARNIDYSNLSDQDLQFLSERTWLIKDAELNGFEGVQAKVDAYLAGEAPVEEEAIPYGEAKVEELRAELERRGLDATGKKAELVARLEADDAAADEDDDDEEDD